MKIDQEKINQILTRGVDEVIDKENLEKKLKSGKKLRIKLGIDPTSPNLHLGRAIPLLKLKDFQEAGHKIVLIIGDFTGLIGDTSDKEAERPMLDSKTIKQNMKTYVAQAGKIIDIKKCEVRYNSEWLGKLDYYEIGKQADQFSLNEFISRENIKKRLDEGKRISLRELMYPLMQGYDSVAVKADVEIGGTDQRFNLLAGRELQRFYKQAPQDIITNPLIEGLDGRKMSSSWENTVNLLDEPNEMFGKIMSLKDEYIIRYFKFCTRIDLAIISQYENQLKAGENPRNFKILLATEIEIFQTNKTNYQVLDLLCDTKLAPSKNEAKRLIEGNAVSMNINDIETKIADWKQEIKLENGMVIKVGKRRFIKIKIIQKF